MAQISEHLMNLAGDGSVKLGEYKNSLNVGNFETATKSGRGRFP